LVLWVLLYLFFIYTDAVFFGLGAAVQNVNTTALEKKMEGKDRQAGKILRIVDRPGSFISTIQAMSVLFGFLTGGMLTGFFIKHYSAAWKISENSVWIFLCAAGFYLVFLIVMVSFGMVIPKRLAERKPEEWAYRCIGPVNVIMTFFLPLIFCVRGLSWVVLRVCGIDPTKYDESVTEEDIMSMVNEGHEQGVVKSDEAEMITNIFELNDKKAGDVMTHRKNICGIDGESTLNQAVDFMLTEGSNSRYPVYRENIDNIIGVLNMKDALICSYKGENQHKRLKEIPGLLRKAYYIPETRALDTLFKEMQSQKIHMEIVVDEYGQTSGVVTMEDILEEIVGNIMDEYDDDEEMITPLKDGTWIVKGLTTLEDLTDGMGIRFSEQEYNDFDTLNGFLISRLDRIPSDGEQFTVKCHDCEFKVLHVQNKIVRTVKVTKTETEDIPENGKRSKKKENEEEETD